MKKMYPSSGIVVGAPRFPFQTFSPGTCSTICWFKFVNICFSSRYFVPARQHGTWEPSILHLHNFKTRSILHDHSSARRPWFDKASTFVDDNPANDENCQRPFTENFQSLGFPRIHIKKATQFISQEPNGKKKSLTFFFLTFLLIDSKLLCETFFLINK